MNIDDKIQELIKNRVLIDLPFGNIRGWEVNLHYGVFSACMIFMERWWKADMDFQGLFPSEDLIEAFVEHPAVSWNGENTSLEYESKVAYISADVLAGDLPSKDFKEMGLRDNLRADLLKWLKRAESIASLEEAEKKREQEIRHRRNMEAFGGFLAGYMGHIYDRSNKRR